jgi:serine/threonine-protein kinase
MTSTAQNRPRPIEVGSILAERYEVVETLGEGGMGCVYKVRHRQIGRIYAVKVMWRSKDYNERDYKRFLQEAKIAGSFTHANLASVYDYGETADGYAFMVMDYVDGISLAELLGQDRLIELNRAVNIFIQICAGLHYAHEKGLIHRDIKPSNIMVVQEGDHEHVKIVDFGITKVLSTTIDTEKDLTRAGEIFGSPFYISPEQCVGDEVDTRSDIYSLGCLMYQVLTGHKPFDGESAVETIIAHLHSAPHTFEEVCPDLKLPRRIEEIVLKCMERVPRDRYQSLSEVAVDLKDFARSPAHEGYDRKELIAAKAAQDLSGKEATTSQKRITALAVIPAIAMTLGIVTFVFCKGMWTVNHADTAAPQASQTSVQAPSQPIATTTTDKGRQENVVEENVQIPVSPVEPSTTPSAQPSQEAKPKSESAPHAVAHKKPEKQETVSAGTETHTSSQAPRTDTVKKKLAIAIPPTEKKPAVDVPKRIALLKSDVLPKFARELSDITGESVRVDIDWESFANNPVALDYFQHSGLAEMREAISEYWQEHKSDDLKTLISVIKIRNVGELHERQAILNSGTLSVSGAWGKGIGGSPTSLEIKLAIAAGA